MLPPLLCPVRHWQPLVPERTGVTIEDMEVFAGYCLIQERRDGLPALSILRLPPSAASRAASTPDLPSVGHLSCERHVKRSLHQPLTCFTAACQLVQVPVPGFALFCCQYNR